MSEEKKERIFMLHRANLAARESCDCKMFNRDEWVHVGNLYCLYQCDLCGEIEVVEVKNWNDGSSKKFQSI